MSETGKRGSSRRKGDDYQDLTALQLVLERYIAGESFEMYLEYEKSGNLDDIVIFQQSEITAYQVKYAVHPLSVYTLNDFLDPESPVSIRKFADSWQMLRQRHANHKLTACLCSNRGIDAALVPLTNADGRFADEFIEDRKRGDAKRIRSDLAAASGRDAASFTAFLADFRFVLRSPTLQNLETHIRTVLLDKELGLTDDAIFFDLRDAIKENALYSRQPITPDTIDKLLERLQSKLLIPQVFPVNREQFVEQKSLSDRLNLALPQISGGYLIVTGLPGSGKSTSLTMYFEERHGSEFEVFSYYCFVGVNDNAQKMRLRAESLRANLLNAFHRRYPNILKKRFDYSERNFIECMETLAAYFVDKGRRFIILLDGLDHAERFAPEIRESVISALPSRVPEGITIVVGTQELHTWPSFLKLARECLDHHIKMPLFSKAETQDYLENRRGIQELSNADVTEIHTKCEGLPLYLQYTAEVLISTGSPKEAVASLAPATGGDIRNYYGHLWEEFDRVGMADARHLCAVMACLRFGVHRNELYLVQQVLSRPAFEDAFKCMSHLLRNTEDRLTIFHNSFREFVLGQISEDWSREIRGYIASFLKTNKNSPRWFEHVFEYCHETEDYSYVLDEVNAEFVDRALLHCRPSGEIVSAIHCALESAFKCRDIVQLSRLGPLRFRTEERVDRNLDRVLLANALLALGREQDVMTFAYSSEANRWLVEYRMALAVMSRLAEEGKIGLGKRLFDIFTDEYRGIDAETKDERKSQVVAISRCLGIYADRLARPLRWLSSFSLDPGTLEQKDLCAPGYAPHLETYIDTLVEFGREEKWSKLQRVKIFFPNNLVRYLLIRALARHNHLSELSAAVREYLAQESSPGNLELAFYAAKAGLPSSDVTAIAGTIKPPKTESPEYISPSDPVLRLYFYSFVIIGYAENENAYESFSSTIDRENTLWTSALHHLLKAGLCIGRSLRSDKLDWYDEALQAIAILVHPEQGDTERISESIELIREALPLSIGCLTDQVEKRYPERLTEWVMGLESLRDSMLWTTHFGINESREYYDYELRLWETLGKSPAARPGLIPILKSCAVTYKNATMLKGSYRSDHFLSLAALMAKCGMRVDAEECLECGIRSSLIYGYRKDVTILLLIEILKLLNQRQPEMALERCARVLTMVRWMPHLTDGAGTKRFVQDAFESVLAVDRQAAFDLLNQFSRTTARWQMQDCLEAYLLSASEGDPEYFWCLIESFCNHYSEEGRHCEQIMRVRQHIVDLVRQTCSEDIYRDFNDRFRHFVMTDIPPRHWPEDLRAGAGFHGETNSANHGTNEGDSKFRHNYIIDGQAVTNEEIAEMCRVSFPQFLETIDKLGQQNEHFYEPQLVDAILSHHIAAAIGRGDLLPIKQYVASQGAWQSPDVPEALAERFLQSGDRDNATACFGLAYARHGSWFRWRHNRKYLAAVAAADREAAVTILLKECYDSARGSGGGYDTPPIAATGLDLIDEPRMLEEVFSDFLSHCETMFAQLPQDDRYAWLKQYEAPKVHLNHLILAFVVNDLETPEIDLGERLVRALTRLAAARPEDTVPSIVNSALDSSGRTKRRLLMVLNSLASEIPESLIPWQKSIARLLDQNDFFIRQTALRILDLLAKVSGLNESVLASIGSVAMAYSPTISYSTYRLPGNPSSEFKAFLQQNTLNDFSKQIAALENILHVPRGTLVAAIEERLEAEGWSINEERDRVEYDWKGHVHVQGWPVVWITTDFHELATESLSIILHESAEKMRLTETQLDRLWRTIQGVDPEYIIRGVTVRPRDISPLQITDVSAWLGEIDTYESVRVAGDRTEIGVGDWVTVFERRRLAQEERYNVPYRQDITLASSLIPRRVYGEASELDEVDFVAERLATPASERPLTLEEARTNLITWGKRIPTMGTHESIPLIAEHQNQFTFLGYRNVCSLASFIIEEMGLSFADFDLLRNGQRVASYEVWQEGYQDEAYTREKLSFGTRLLVRRDLLSDICQKYQRLLCTCVYEERMYFSSIHNRRPDDSRQSARYILHYL